MLPGGHLSLWSPGTLCHAMGCLPPQQPPRGVNDSSLCTCLHTHGSSVQSFWRMSSVTAQHTWPRSHPCARRCGTSTGVAAGTSWSLIPIEPPSDLAAQQMALGGGAVRCDTADVRASGMHRCGRTLSHTPCRRYNPLPQPPPQHNSCSCDTSRTPQQHPGVLS